MQLCDSCHALWAIETCELSQKLKSARTISPVEASFYRAAFVLQGSKRPTPPEIHVLEANFEDRGVLVSKTRAEPLEMEGPWRWKAPNAPQKGAHPQKCALAFGRELAPPKDIWSSRYLPTLLG